jgi:RNA polymerase sigma factor (sigma-70 family)
MSKLDVEGPLKPEALREIERSLHGKLKARWLSESFIERHGEEALQKGLFEYFRAIKAGVVVENRDAFVVDIAFKRAIDELRREARLADSAMIEGVLETPRFAAPATEDLAIEYVAAEELREAIEALSEEERQLLSLYYFEQLSAKKGAEVLYCSERTFRRRLRRALGNLSRRLGVPAPEPGSALAIEIGLAAWVSVRGARVAISHGLLDYPIGALEGARNHAGMLLDRIRDLGTRLGPSGAGEKIGAIAGTPSGRIVGCAGAAAACVLGGALGAGVGEKATELFGSHAPAPHAKAQARLSGKEKTTPAAPMTSKAPPGSASPPTGQGEATKSARDATAARQARARSAERHRVKKQASAWARAGSESELTPPPSASSAAATTEETVTVAPESGGEPLASEEAQAAQQFGAFK